MSAQPCNTLFIQSAYVVGKTDLKLNQYLTCLFENLLCFTTLIVHRRQRKLWFNVRTDFAHNTYTTQDHILLMQLSN